MKKVTALDESIIKDIGHAFGYYDYGTEHGLIDAFPSRDAAAAFICGYVRMALRGGMLYTTSERGEGLRKRLDKEKKPYLYVGMVCVRERYQGQGYMRKVLEAAFSEGRRLGVPVILDTDAKSKCDKYLHLGMELAGTRRFGEHGVLYDLIKYPEPSEHEKGSRETTK